jgi:hypothetical protein
MDHLRSKTRSQELKIEKAFNTLVAAVLIQTFWKFVWTFFFDDFWIKFEDGLYPVKN